MNQISDLTLRILDANLNRLREGIRVIEDVLRYGFDQKDFALQLKNLRHRCKINPFKPLLQSRDSQNDVLKASIKEEQNRTDLKDVIVANFKRTQESARVLEEILKLNEIEKSEEFKEIRYMLYTLEKEILNSLNL